MKATKENLKLGDWIQFINCNGCPFEFTIIRMSERSVWVSNGHSTCRKSWLSISKYDILTQPCSL